jgi:tripartite-type tricarboxylate transporter receptor subunit TctC
MFAAGTGADTIVRFYANKLQKPAGMPVVVEIKAGMGGSMAAGYVAHAKPDGYTIFMSRSSVLAAAPWIFKKLPYDPIKDFASVTTLFKATFVMVVPATSPFQTVAQLTEHLKKVGSKGSYGSATYPGKIASEIYKSQMGLETVEVPYKSGIDVLNDLNAGLIDYYFTDSGTVMSQIGSGKLRALMTTSKERFSALPDISSAAEAGLNMDLVAYWGLYVPAKTPRDVIEKLATWTNPIVSEPDTKAFLANLGYDTWIGDARSVSDMVARESQLWSDYVKLARIDPQ